MKQFGRYLEVDADGYIIKQASQASLQAEWRPVVDRVIEIYAYRYGQALHSVYVRGSVAAGHAVHDVSDLDMLCVVHEFLSSERVVVQTVAAMKTALHKDYPFVARFELLTRPLYQVRARRSLQKLIAVEAVCMTGWDLSGEFPRFKIGGESAFEFRDICGAIRRCIRRLLTNSDPVSTCEYCLWITRRILRTGFELVMARERRYTRDLYLCYESFSKHYPEYSDEMYAILALAVNPTSERPVLLQTLCRCLVWLEPAIADILGADTTVPPMSGRRGAQTVTTSDSPH